MSTMHKLACYCAACERAFAQINHFDRLRVWSMLPGKRQTYPATAKGHWRNALH